MQAPYCPFPALSSPLCSLCTTWHYSAGGRTLRDSPGIAPCLLLCSFRMSHVNVECFPRSGCPWLILVVAELGWIHHNLVCGALQNFTIVMNCGNPSYSTKSPYKRGFSEIPSTFVLKVNVKVFFGRIMNGNVNVKVSEKETGAEPI